MTGSTPGEGSIAETPKQGDVIADKYRVERTIGAGGFGVVLEATQLDVGRKVALKLLLPELGLTERFVERFTLEAQLARPWQGDGHGVAALGRHAVPVLAPANGHRVAHLGPVGVLEDAQVAAHGQGHRLERRGAQAALEAGHQATVVQLVAVQQHLGAGRVGEQGQRPVALQVGQVPRSVCVALGQGVQVLAEQGLRAGSFLSRSLGGFVLGPVAGGQGGVGLGQVGRMCE